MNDRLYIGSVGTSSIMKVIQEAIRITPGLSCKVIYSRDPQRGRSFAKELGIAESCNDYTKMLEREDLDIIYIASPNKLHFTQAQQALEHRKHVIIEKPVAVTQEEVKILYDTAKRNNVFFFEAITTLFMPNYIAMSEYLPQLGNLEEARISFGKYSSKYDAYLRGENPNIFNPEMQTGALNDMGIYCIHAALHLFGMPKEIRYDAEYGINGIDLSGVLHMEYPDFTCRLETAKNKDIPCGIQIKGASGRICAEGPLNSMPECYAELEGKRHLINMQGTENRMIYELTRFRDAIKNNDTVFFESMAMQSMRAAFILQQAHRGNDTN